jgi:hypothetical protein
MNCNLGSRGSMWLLSVLIVSERLPSWLLLRYSSNDGIPQALVGLPLWQLFVKMEKRMERDWMEKEIRSSNENYY